MLLDNDEIPDATELVTPPVAAESEAEIVFDTSAVVVASSEVTASESMLSVIAASVTEASVEISVAEASVAVAGAVVSGYPVVVPTSAALVASLAGPVK